MNIFEDTGFIVAAFVIVAIIIVLVCISRWIKTVPPSTALIISGANKDGKAKVVKQGGRTVIIPLIQSSDIISLAQNMIEFSVPCVDKNSVEVSVKAVAMVKVGSSEDMIRAAAERFRGVNDDMSRNTQQVLVGELRSIISQMTISDLISNRDELRKAVLINVSTQLENMGLHIETLQISDITTDTNGYIAALGIPESERVQKEARIAKARNEQEANEAEVASRTLIAEKNKELSVRQSELKAETDRAHVESASAGPLAEAEKDREIAEVNQRAAEARAILRERELDTEVRKPADARNYERVKEAEAAKAESVLEAEAIATALKLSSESESNAIRVRAKADAESVTAKGVAQASAIEAEGLAKAKSSKAQGLAEAEAMNKKAEAFREYNDAATLSLIIDKMPEIAHEMSAPMANIKDLSIISTDGAGALPKAVANNFAQLDTVIKSTTGISVSDVIAKAMNKSDTETTIETNEEA